MQVKQKHSSWHGSWSDKAHVIFCNVQALTSLTLTALLSSFAAAAPGPRRRKHRLHNYITENPCWLSMVWSFDECHPPRNFRVPSCMIIWEEPHARSTGDQFPGE